VTVARDARGWYSIEGDVEPGLVDELRKMGAVDNLSLTGIPLVTVELAQRLAGLRVHRLWLWCDITRRALRQLIRLPGLRVLDVLCIKGPGTLGNFRSATGLKEFRCNHYMSEADLLEVAKCAGLQELGAQGALISTRSLAALLSLPELASLDLEATSFDDKMARQVSRSRTITHLDIGSTRITRTGLAHLVRMKQLRSLDLWATQITEDDLQLLLELPDLEYVSLGNHDGLRQLDSETVTRFMLTAPSLKRAWLDGIHLEHTQQQALEARLESLRVSSLSDVA
jgi:hypothetical protein